MRLFTPAEAKVKKSKELEADIMKATKIGAILSERIAKLNEFMELDVKKRQEITNEFKAFESGMNETKDNLLKEVKSLEERKNEALKPTKEREKACDLREQTLVTQESDYLFRVKELDELEERIDSHAEKLQDWEDELKDEQATINLITKQTKKASDLVEKSLKELNKKWLEFHAESARKDKEIADEWLVIKAERKELEIKTLELAEAKDKLAKDKKALQDAYATLERSKTRLQKSK